MTQDEDYYTRVGTTVSLIDALKSIYANQGEEFPVRVRFTYIDANGVKRCASGPITGVLDNGDEVYIDAETIDVTRFKGNSI